MLVLSARVLDCPIMSLQTGVQIAQTTQAIIDPRQLTIVAFYCEGPNVGFTPAVLHANDIREFGPLGMIIDNSDKIMQPQDLVRLQEVMGFNFQLMDKQVVDDRGKKIGKVADFTLETSSFYIIKLHIKQSLLRNFTSADLIIDRAQIRDINDKNIIVSSPTVHEETKARPAKQSVIENPFRRARPQENIEQE